jgi:catechol 2,3-dioxygenase-like lactoylglutathione lyase family enzyme
MDTHETQARGTMEEAAPAIAFVGVMHEGVPVATANLDACIKFYAEVLGLHQIPRPKALDDIGRGAWLEDADKKVQFHLIASDAEQRPLPGCKIAPAGRHTAWIIQDVSAFRARMEALGIHYEEIGSLVGRPQLFLQDPEGHTWEFQEPFR